MEELASQPPSESDQTQQQQQQIQLLQRQQYQDYYNYYYSNQAYDPSSSYNYYSSYYQQWPQQQQYDPQNYTYYQPPVYYQQPHESIPQIPDTQQLQQPVSGHDGSVTVTVPPPANANVMNPAAAAAIAALDRLRHFAGTMDAAERAMAGLPPVNTPAFQLVSMRPPPPAGQYPHGGGGRAGGSFRGGHHVSAPPFRGKGRNKGKTNSRRGHQGAASTSSHPEPSANENPAAVAVEAAQPKHRSVRIAWCELCRVDCTSMEILEQHKNGKRHKKNLLRIEGLKKDVKPGVVQNGQKLTTDPELKVSQKPQLIQDGAEQKSAGNLNSASASDESRIENSLPDNPEKLTHAAASSEPAIENNVQDNTQNLTIAVTSSEPAIDSNLQDSTTDKPEILAELSNQQGTKRKKNSFDQSHGMKHKKISGGGKHTKALKKPVEPRKPKVVIPLICHLCNVKCDTQEVLDGHYAGKKHIAKLKRYEGHQATYGPTGLQALYPPNTIAQMHFAPQGHQPFYPLQGAFPTQFPSQAHQPIGIAAASMPAQFLQSSMPKQPEGSSSTNPASAVLKL